MVRPNRLHVQWFYLYEIVHPVSFHSVQTNPAHMAQGPQSRAQTPPSHWEGLATLHKNLGLHWEVTGISDYQWNCRIFNFLLQHSLLWNHQLLANGWKQTVTENDYCTMAKENFLVPQPTDQQIDFEDWAKSDSL